MVRAATRCASRRPRRPARRGHQRQHEPPDRAAFAGAEPRGVRGRHRRRLRRHDRVAARGRRRRVRRRRAAAPGSLDAEAADLSLAFVVPCANPYAIAVRHGRSRCGGARWRARRRHRERRAGGRLAALVPAHRRSRSIVGGARGRRVRWSGRQDGNEAGASLRRLEHGGPRPVRARSPRSPADDGAGPRRAGEAPTPAWSARAAAALRPSRRRSSAIWPSGGCTSTSTACTSGGRRR